MPGGSGIAFIETPQLAISFLVCNRRELEAINSTYVVVVRPRRALYSYVDTWILEKDI